MKTLHLVKCSDYNGHKDVLFCMASDDPRFDNGNYTPLSKLRKVGKTFEDEQEVAYLRFSDWSMRPAQ